MCESAEKIRVTGKGMVLCGFDRADFSVVIKTWGENGPAAKEQAKEFIESLHKVVQDHAERARLNTRNLRTRFDVTMQTQVNSKTQRVEHTGYLAVFTMRFSAHNVSAAMSLHDDLTTLDRVEVASPEFVIMNRDSVEEDAFQKAVKEAKGKFLSQCGALGLSPDQYEVVNWRVGEDEHRGKTVRYSDPSESGKVTVESGKGELTLTVDVYYQRKNASR